MATRYEEDDPYSQGPLPKEQDPATKTSRPNQLGDILANVGSIATLFPGIRDILSGGNQSAANSAYQNAVNALIASTPKELTGLIPKLQLQMVEGLITPAQAQIAIQQASAANNIKPDPTAVRAQVEALNQLQKISKEGGLTAIDRAKLNEIRNRVNSDNKANQLALQNEFQSRGLGGSGLELVSRLVADQQSSNRASDAATDVAALAEERMLKSIIDSGNLAGDIREQTSTEDINKARAQDAVSALNAQLAQQANLTNATNDQRSREANQRIQQDVSNANVGIRNQQALLPIELRKEENRNRADFARNAADVYRNQGQQLQTQADKTTKQNSSTLSKIANNAGSYIETGKKIFDLGKAIFSDEELKTNIVPLTDDEVNEIGNKLTGYKYSYKKDVGIPGKQIGVMAQDVETTPMKDKVVDTDEGKVIVDNEGTDGQEMAILANMIKRIQDLEE